MKKTLLLALTLIAVGCTEPIPRNVDELVQQSDDCLGAPREGYHRCWDILVPDGLSGSVPLLVDLHGWFEEGDPPDVGTKENQRRVSGFEEIANILGIDMTYSRAMYHEVMAKCNNQATICSSSNMHP